MVQYCVWDQKEDDVMKRGRGGATWVLGDAKDAEGGGSGGALANLSQPLNLSK